MSHTVSTVAVSADSSIRSRKRAADAENSPPAGPNKQRRSSSGEDEQELKALRQRYEKLRDLRETQPEHRLAALQQHTSALEEASQRLHQQLREENIRLIEQNHQLTEENNKLTKIVNQTRILAHISIEPTQSDTNEVYMCLVGQKDKTSTIKFEIHPGSEEFDYVPLSIDENTKSKLPECLQAEFTADNSILPGLFGQLLCSVQNK